MQFNKCVKTGNIHQGYKIMDFIATKVRLGKYMHDAMDSVKVPLDVKFTGFLNNIVYYDYLYNHHVVTEDQNNQLLEIQKLDPANNIVNYNVLFCKLMLDSSMNRKEVQADFQAKIDAFYKTEIPKKTIDALNIEFQFKLLDAIDTIEGTEAQVETIIAKIKAFYNFKDASWQNALKVAYAFARAKDYRYAAGILEPYIKQGIKEKNLT